MHKPEKNEIEFRFVKHRELKIKLILIGRFILSRWRCLIFGDLFYCLRWKQFKTIAAMFYNFAMYGLQQCCGRAQINLKVLSRYQAQFSFSLSKWRLSDISLNIGLFILSK